MENVEKGLMGWNIYILFDSQAAPTVRNSFQINCKLACNYHKSMMNLAKHNRIQLVQVPGHMGIDGNEIVISQSQKAPHITHRT
jgi:hypothetical protein